MLELSKIGVIVQARLSSNRFPRKVLAKLENKEVLLWTLEACRKMDLPVIVAIPKGEINDELETWCIEKGYEVYRGKEYDVLDRFYQAAKLHKLDIIIRVCGENPMLETRDIQDNLNKFLSEKRFVYGNGSWVFNFAMLEYAWKNITDAETREHVVRAFMNTIDYHEDLVRIESGKIF